MAQVTIWRSIQISSPNLVSIRLLTDYWLTPNIQLTHIKQTLRIFLEMTLDLNLESCPNQLSKFGELFKSALQIWLPFHSWLTPGWLLTSIRSTEFTHLSSTWSPHYSWLTLDWLPTSNRLTLNPTKDSKKFVVDDTRSQFGVLSK